MAAFACLGQQSVILRLLRSGQQLDVWDNRLFSKVDEKWTAILMFGTGEVDEKWTAIWMFGTGECCFQVAAKWTIFWLFGT